MAFEFFQCLYFFIMHAIHMHWTGRLLLSCTINISHDCRMNIYFNLNEQTSVMCVKLGTLFHGMKECLMGSCVCPFVWEIVYASELLFKFLCKFDILEFLKSTEKLLVSLEDYSMNLFVKTLGQNPLIKFFRVKFTFTQCTVMKSVLLCRVSTICYWSLRIVTFFQYLQCLLLTFLSSVKFLSEELV